MTILFVLKQDHPLVTLALPQCNVTLHYCHYLHNDVRTGAASVWRLHVASCCGLRLPILVTEATVTGDTGDTLTTPSLSLAPYRGCWLGPAAAVRAVQLRSPRRLRYH